MIRSLPWRFSARALALMYFLPMLAACSGEMGGGPAPKGNPAIKKVTAETYMSGRKFCETYEAVTSQEHGVRIQVPVDYSNPNGETMEVYAFTLKPFDSSKPSYIFLDGGPGQNTHEIMGAYFPGEVNEIHFDQRGLGCSAPETWEKYLDQKLYSTQNTIRDLEVVRKHYGISKWSVFGISYGTVPATMYGSKYPNSTTSVILEGVAFDGALLHKPSYKAEKLNIFLKGLTSKQRLGFNEIMKGDRPESQMFVGYLLSLFYSDAGLRSMLKKMSVIIDSDGKVNWALLTEIKSAMEKTEAKYPLPQQPGAVDSNVMTIIYCKELEYRSKGITRLDYSASSGFFEGYGSSSGYGDDCDKVNVSSSEARPYKASEYPLTVPTYYFQGSHDGATLAAGAIKHWETVPKGKSYFMLAQKGGHNPNMTRLEDKENSTLQIAQRLILKKAITGQAITQSDIDLANRYQNDSAQNWLLFLEPSSSFKLGTELQGIRFTPALVSESVYVTNFLKTNQS